MSASGTGWPAEPDSAPGRPDQAIPQFQDAAASDAGSTPGRLDQVVLHFHWEEKGLQRQETYGPWAAAEDMGHLVQVSEFIKRWLKVTGIAPHAITIALALDPEAWLQDREQAAAEATVTPGPDAP